MSRIAPEDMATLISASEAKTVASTAKSELEEMSVAHCINEAANTGETRAVYCRPMSDEMKTKLEGQGYKVLQPYPLAKHGDEYIISWKDAD